MNEQETFSWLPFAPSRMFRDIKRITSAAEAAVLRDRDFAVSLTAGPVFVRRHIRGELSYEPAPDKNFYVLVDVRGGVYRREVAQGDQAPQRITVIRPRTRGRAKGLR